MKKVVQKFIYLILAISIFSTDISLSYSLDYDVSRSAVAASSCFQQSVNGYDSKRQQPIFSESAFLASIYSVGEYFFGDSEKGTKPLPSKYAEKVIEAKLGQLLHQAGIEILNIITDNNIVLIRYRQGDKKFLIQIAEKDKALTDGLPGRELDISDKYSVKYIDEDHLSLEVEAIKDPSTTNDLTAYELMANILRKDLDISLPASRMIGDWRSLISKKIIDRNEVGQNILPYPEGVNVGIYMRHMPGAELFGLLAQEEDCIEGVNFLYLIQSDYLFTGKYNPDMVFTNFAVFFKDGKLGYAHFDKPVRIHAIAHAGDAIFQKSAKYFESKGIPMFTTTAVSDLCVDKIKFKEFLIKNGIDTPRYTVIYRKDFGFVSSQIGRFVNDNKLRGIVIKPFNGGRGEGVKMFSRKDIQEAAHYALGLLKNGEKVLLEERIESEYWPDDEGKRLDWNLRVLATWEKNKALIRPEMIVVRYDKCGNDPVNISTGASAMPIDEFIEKRGYDDAFLAGIQSIVKKGMERLAQEGGRGKDGLVGWDLMKRDSGDWTILEAQTGMVGGISKLEKTHSDKGRHIGAGRYTGVTAIHFMRFLKDMAEGYRDESGKGIVTDEGGAKMRPEDDPWCVYNLARAYEWTGRHLLAISTLKKVEDRYPKAKKILSFYKEMQNLYPAEFYKLIRLSAPASIDNLVRALKELQTLPRQDRVETGEARQALRQIRKKYKLSEGEVRILQHSIGNSKQDVQVPVQMALTRDEAGLSETQAQPTPESGITGSTDEIIRAMREAQITLPKEWYFPMTTPKATDFTAELSQSLQTTNVLNSDKSTFIFSEKVTFDNGFGVFLPKLANLGMKIAVIATNDRQRTLIDESNKCRPGDERIIYADTIADIRAKIHTARYYYFKVSGDPDADLHGIITFDITDIVKKIVDALGKASGIIERERLEFMHEAARKFAEAA